MKYRLSSAYLEALFASGSYDALAELLALLAGSSTYDRWSSDYGLGIELFVFAESLLWFAQSTRSGAVTYFEAAPLERQKQMQQALSRLAPPEFATTYA